MTFLTLFCFLEFNRSNKQKEFCNQSNINLKKYYSDIGFYRVLIQNSDIINVFLNGGKHRLYFFIPYHIDFYIQDIVIDGKTVYNKTHLIGGLSIEGNDNATIRFRKVESDNKIEANFWILPSTMCQKNSGYVFGSRVIEVHSDLDQLCIFSPSFDSSNYKFDIKSGIPFADGYHYSRVYTNDFENPTYVNDGNQIEQYKLKTANFVSFYSANFTLKYKRITNIRKYSYFYYYLNLCTANSVYKCSKIGCSSADVFKSIKCNSHTTEDIVIIVALNIGVPLVVIIPIYFICFKIIKKRTNRRLNELLNTVPLSNENEYYTQQDLNENENYTQQDLSENENYTQQDLNPSNENDYIRYKNIY